MKRTLAVLFIAAAVGGFVTYAALQLTQRIQTASAQVQAVVELAAASHGVDVMSAQDGVVSPDQPAPQAAQALLSALKAGGQ